MPITIHCPHDKTELEFVPDGKTPEGLLECPVCHCTFRVCLAIFDKKCYIKQYPKLMGAELKEEKKRGRPKKEEVEDNAS